MATKYRVPIEVNGVTESWLFWSYAPNGAIWVIKPGTQTPVEAQISGKDKHGNTRYVLKHLSEAKKGR